MSGKDLLRHFSASFVRLGHTEHNQVQLRMNMARAHTLMLFVSFFHFPAALNGFHCLLHQKFIVLSVLLE